MSTAVLNVEEIVERIRNAVHAERRLRLARPGGAKAYTDPLLYEAVEQILRRAIEDRDRSLLLIPELIGQQNELTPALKLRISSHRRILGPIIVFAKRRFLLPLTRWLFEYTSRNFERQQELNMLLFACVEELAIEVARLRDLRRSE